MIIFITARHRKPIGVPAKDELSSKVVGLDLYNNDHQNIGMIKDVAYSGTRVSGFILGDGGFLGMGDHQVRRSAVRLSYDANGMRLWTPMLLS